MFKKLFIQLQTIACVLKCFLLSFVCTIIKVFFKTNYSKQYGCFILKSETQFCRLESKATEAVFCLNGRGRF